jgi:hypothetical protein
VGDYVSVSDDASDDVGDYVGVSDDVSNRWWWVFVTCDFS